MISVETYVLSKNYTDQQIENVESVAINAAVDQAVEEAVDAANRYTDQRIAIADWEIEIVNELPLVEEIVHNHTIYFVPMSEDEENNNYYEYIYLQENDSWELIGSTEFKPNDYMTKQNVMAYVEAKKYILPAATNNDLGGVKIDSNSIVVNNDGRISISNISNNDIARLFH